MAYRIGYLIIIVSYVNEVIKFKLIEKFVNNLYDYFFNENLPTPDQFRRTSRTINIISSSSYYLFLVSETVSVAFKAYILLVLTVNACGYILLIRFTRDQSGPMYYSTTTVREHFITLFLYSALYGIKSRETFLI